MPKGAIHPNGTNFIRRSRLDIVARGRRLVQTGLLDRKQARWLEWCERVPPMENENLHLQARKIRNPYVQMVKFLLNKYPDLRFQDCYVDGNDWSVGNDAYRDDHPVMQFVARQLELMNKGVAKKEAFQIVEEQFRERRMHLEREQKILMAMAAEENYVPMFQMHTTGKAYLAVVKAQEEMEHLQKIHKRLRDMRAQRNDQFKDKTDTYVSPAQADTSRQRDMSGFVE
mmetsp:Transcript_50114/g.92491  ORF Transcript_50114/g.92491 Transcript_50114/m.92491 type:complete len:228 (-) Transcript_50114:56-739(-)